MDTRLCTILTDRDTPRLDFVGINAFTFHLYALAYTNCRVEYIIIAAESFSSNERRIWNSEAEFWKPRNSRIPLFTVGPFKYILCHYNSRL